MRRIGALTALGLAWLCANGTLWDCVQVLAWGRMLHEYARILPLAKAVEKTFDGSAPCELCEVVKNVESHAPAQAPVERSTEKVLLACQLPEAIVVLAPGPLWPGARDRVGLTRTEPVPVPPPRV
ncbi:MAG: hypothetical protein ACHQ4G_00150 [Opitutales bacterium]